MLTIRREQMDAMHEYRLQEWWRVRARASHPQVAKSMGAEAFRERIRAAVERARGGGIQDPEEIAQFIDLALLWGDEFDTPEHTPWVAEILGWEGTEARVKIGALLRESTRAQDARWVREQQASEER